ncbi:hypothetical protein P691DRAFT_686761, partial [Macrolepiota fuliginosa MF-IS2]
PEAVPVPNNHCTLGDKEMTAFCHQLASYWDSDFIPKGYGMHCNEWDGGENPPYEDILVRRQGLSLCIELPPSIWLPCTEDWV